MRTKNVLVLLLPFYFLSCGFEENEEEKKKPAHSKLKNIPSPSIVLDNRFLSKDRDVKKIFADYEKPIESYPKIWQNESVIKKNGRLYRKDVWDEPFTGTVVENFPDGSVSLETSYYRGLPHGKQNRNFESGQIALQANFDQGVLVGVKSRWWPSGILREEAYWSEGKYIGRRLWDSSGRLLKEEIVPQG